MLMISDFLKGSHASRWMIGVFMACNFRSPSLVGAYVGPVPRYGDDVAPICGLDGLEVLFKPARFDLFRSFSFLAAS